MSSHSRSDSPSELELIETFSRAFKTDSPSVLVSVGDDAAVFRGAGKLAWTIDDAVEGVHFRRSWMTLGQAAGRAFDAAVSDLAAMGALPVAALSVIGAPVTAKRGEFDAVRKAQRAAMKRLGCPIIGGNVTRSEAWRFTTTAIGRVEHPVLRTRARPGHELWLIGNVGEAVCGRLWLERALPLPDDAKTRRAVEACLVAFRRPRALLAAGQTLDGRVHSAIDLSDGLGADSLKLANASGVRLAIHRFELESALRPVLRRAALPLGVDPLQLALGGGEDYALLVAGPARRKPPQARTIGEVRRGSGAFLVDGAKLVPCELGFDHLRR